MGDHIIYGPNWGILNSDKVSINHYSGKTDTHQDFLRQIRICCDPLRKKSGCLRWLSGKTKILLPTQETWVQFLGREDPWRRAWQPTPVFLPGESHGQRSPVGYRS